LSGSPQRVMGADTGLRIRLSRPADALRCQSMVGDHRVSSGLAVLGQSKSETGDFDTLPTYEAPRKVVERAVKWIGHGLNGVDIQLQ